MALSKVNSAQCAGGQKATLGQRKKGVLENGAPKTPDTFTQSLRKY
jgi:hypothetical protein